MKYYIHKIVSALGVESKEVGECYCVTKRKYVEENDWWQS